MSASSPWWRPPRRRRRGQEEGGVGEYGDSTRIARFEPLAASWPAGWLEACADGPPGPAFAGSWPPSYRSEPSDSVPTTSAAGIGERMSDLRGVSQPGHEWRSRMPEVRVGAVVGERGGLRGVAGGAVDFGEDIESWSERGRGVVEGGWVQLGPVAGVDAAFEGFEGDDALGRGEGAVAGAANVELAEEGCGARLTGELRVGLLIFDRDLAVADRVQCEDGAAQVPGEVAGRVEVGVGRWVGVDAGRAVKCGEVGGEVQTGGPVERHDVSVVGGARELAGVVHPRVPGWVAAGVLFEVGPAVGGSGRGPEAKPACEVGGALAEVNRRGFGTAGVEPGREVEHCGAERQACASGRCSQGAGDDLLRECAVAARVGEVDEGKLGARCEQRLQHEGGVETLVPYPGPAAERSAHRDSAAEAAGEALDQACADEAAE